MKNNSWFLRITISFVLILGSMQASAGLLTFEWGFANVTGTVEGLMDNTPDQMAGQVTITSAPGALFITPLKLIDNLPTRVSKNSWTVAGGVITDFTFVAFDLGGVNNSEVFIAGTPGGRFAGELRIPGQSDRKEPLTFGPATVTVPEPGSLALLGLGLAGIGWSRRKTTQ